jgi:hypothetical protein
MGLVCRQQYAGHFEGYKAGQGTSSSWTSGWGMLTGKFLHVQSLNPVATAKPEWLGMGTVHTAVCPSSESTNWFKETN